MTSYPTFEQLEYPDDTGFPLAWGVWGPDDQLGSLNHISDEIVARAAGLVRRGTRFNLDLPLHLPYGALKPPADLSKEGFANRRVYEPTLFTRDDGDLIARDDKLDNFYLQSSTQWDSLCHYGDIKHGFYNGVRPDQITHGEGARNGINTMAEFGIAGRGVLVDLVRYFAHAGREWDPMAKQVVSPDDLLACLEHQGVELAAGDLLLVRMGWLKLFLETEDLDTRHDLFHSWRFSGLSGQLDMWAFLWDRKIAAVATDTVTVEVWPREKNRACLHLAIARMGFVLGEMFDLEALADDCDQDGRYTFLLTSSPLNLRGGVGSPANAIAIK